MGSGLRRREGYESVQGARCIQLGCRIEGDFKRSKQGGDEILTELPVLEEDVEFHLRERN